MGIHAHTKFGNSSLYGYENFPRKLIQSRDSSLYGYENFPRKLIQSRDDDDGRTLECNSPTSGLKKR